MKTQIAFLLAFLLCGSILTAQDHLFITGKIIDKKSGDPISYAHVGIPEKGIGTTTGYDGNFRFKVPKYYKNSTMIVSYIGYKTFRFPISQIKESMIIKLETADNALTEIVVIEPSQVEDIIRRAVKNIPKNYPTHATKTLGFYRESRTDENLNYTYMAEGVLTIYKNSYKSSKEGYVSLVQGRRINLKNPLDTVIRSGFTSGHMAAHRFDIVQNREDFLQELYFPVYKYWIEGMTTYNEKPVYIIGFDKDPEGQPFVKRKKGIFGFGKKNQENGRDQNIINIGKGKIKYTARMRGKIFIEQESYAIIKTEFEIREEGLRKRNDYPLYSGNWDGNSYTVNYRKVGKKWYFSDAVREGDYSGGGIYSNEIKITEINPEKAKPLPYLDRISRGSAFARMTGSYNPDFWQNYNTTPFGLDLAKSIQQIENAQKAKEVFDNDYMLLLQSQRDSIKAAAELKEKTEMAERLARGEISKIDFQEMIMEQRPVRKSKNKRDFSVLKFMFGTGTHLITTQQDNLSLTLLSDDENPSTITSLTDDIGTRNFEIISYWNLDFSFRKNLFLRFGSGWDYGNSIYKEKNIGLGTQLNLSRQRPFYIKAIAQYSNLKYARKLGSADADFGKFKLNGKKFKGNSFNLYYGNRTHNLKLSGELSIELDPGREFYVRAAYWIPFHQRADVWVKERKQIFRRKNWISAADDRIEIFRNDAPFIDDTLPDATFSISVGLLFK